MKKYLPCAAGVVMGLCFIAASLPILLNRIKMPELPTDTPIGHFMAAFGPTGYVKFVKMFELVGGILVMIPRLRNVGLLLVGPVIVNIIAFDVFVAGPIQLLNFQQNWMLYVIVVCALYLLWVGRRNFSGLLNYAQPR